MLIVRGMKTIPVNRPFAGGPGLKVYGGVGSDPTAIAYRANKIFDPQCLPLNPSFNNDVSLATVNSPTAVATFTAPAAWFGQTVWLNVRTFGGDLENEQIAGARRLDLDGSGNAKVIFAGTGYLLGVDPVDSGGAVVRFIWKQDSNSVGADHFAAVRLTGPTSPADFVVTPSSARIARLRLTSLSVGTYTFRIEVRRSGSTSITLGTATVIIPAVPSTTATISLVPIG
jgi:hypothetical protein